MYVPKLAVHFAKALGEATAIIATPIAMGVFVANVAKTLSANQKLAFVVSATAMIPAGQTVTKISANY